MQTLIGATVQVGLVRVHTKHETHRTEKGLKYPID